jgi:hypothetical protein
LGGSHACSPGSTAISAFKASRDYERVDPKGKAFLKAARWRRQPNPISDDYPFVLITGRVVYHFHTRTKTGRSAALNERASLPYVEIHPADAARLRSSLAIWSRSPRRTAVGRRRDGRRFGPTRRSLRAVSLRPRRAIG